MDRISPEVARNLQREAAASWRRRRSRAAPSTTPGVPAGVTPKQFGHARVNGVGKFLQISARWCWQRVLANSLEFADRRELAAQRAAAACAVHRWYQEYQYKYDHQV